MISFLFSLLSGCSRLTSWSIVWTRWKRNASWRGTSLWSWKMILKTDPKRSRFWSWSGKMRWWRLKSKSYSPSFRYKSRLLCLKFQPHQRTLPVYPVIQQASTTPCLQAPPHFPSILSHVPCICSPALLATLQELVSGGDKEAGGDSSHLRDRDLTIQQGKWWLLQEKVAWSHLKLNTYSCYSTREHSVKPLPAELQ